MISHQKRLLRRLTLFVASLLCTVLFASLPSFWQSATAASHSNSVETVQQFDAKAELAPFSNPAFDEVAASHLEPNFY
jgi:hypothetical protein